MGLALTGVAVVIFGTVGGPIAGVIAGACAMAGEMVFWVLLPLRIRHEAPPLTE
jgi:hypothetical protein